MKKIFFALLLFGCNQIYPETTPFQIDSKFRECNEYEIIDKKNLTIIKKKTWPIEYCHNFWAIPPDQKEEWVKFLRKKIKEQDKKVSNETY